MRQTTLAKPISASGIGLHTGIKANITLKPAPENTGYIFVRKDLDDFEIPASIEYISHCSYATTLLRNGVVISTCEHLLSALRGMEVDNCFIEIDEMEVPILDGSSKNFVRMIEEAGIRQQQLPRRILKVTEKIEVVEDSRKISIEPYEGFKINCIIDFPHPLIRRQEYEFEMKSSNFKKEIAPARTFGFFEEVERLRRANLAKGGSLENAIVLTRDQILNSEPLRFENEFVRHKILDIIGDFALLGLPIQGKIYAEKSGHALHASLMIKLIKNSSAWKIIESFRMNSAKI
ncbi:MAG: UDP-3-O-acyl-N-acetylglucosamine deacetylase [Pyrinomonadaceae bacterium]|nr:UDP-3-O-acyl-N-acetylglucosamine deacetylase [Pyrinomonadaceae bacterium]MCX7640592.1 UDP-3-O-acyl-N-acetylglucosamine deacetylase [Pyrinomonadaceae bacterium]MDW8303827.1 UDP-3-O-acyl-N-acetylglucosamine deacetylase [Acidobacteriota bacterium]